MKARMGNVIDLNTQVRECDGKNTLFAESLISSGTRIIIIVVCQCFIGGLTCPERSKGKGKGSFKTTSEVATSWGKFS